MDRQEFLETQNELAAAGGLSQSFFSSLPPPAFQWIFRRAGAMPDNELVLLEEVKRLNDEMDEQEMLFEMERSELIKMVNKLETELQMVTEVRAFVFLPSLCAAPH